MALRGESCCFRWQRRFIKQLLFLNIVSNLEQLFKLLYLENNLRAKFFFPLRLLLRCQGCWDGSSVFGRKTEELSQQLLSELFCKFNSYSTVLQFCTTVLTVTYCTVLTVLGDPKPKTENYSCIYLIDRVNNIDYRFKSRKWSSSSIVGLAFVRYESHCERECDEGMAL